MKCWGIDRNLYMSSRPRSKRALIHLEPTLGKEMEGVSGGGHGKNRDALGC